jgi:hypothetical protein
MIESLELELVIEGPDIRPANDKNHSRFDHANRSGYEGRRGSGLCLEERTAWVRLDVIWGDWVEIGPSQSTEPGCIPWGEFVRHSVTDRP